MPDYIRIGPPWGQINWIPNSGLKNQARGGYARPAEAQGWSASGASLAATAVASWSVGSGIATSGFTTDWAPDWSPDGGGYSSGGDPGWGGFQITSATTIPSGQILAVALIPVPSARGVWTFQGEVRGATNVRVWGEMHPVVATGASAYATHNVGTGLPAAFSTETGTFRWTGQYPNGTFDAPSQFAPFEGENVKLVIRAGAAVASGDAIAINQIGLFQLDAEFPQSTAAIASIYAGATRNGDLLGRPFSGFSKDKVTFDVRGLVARWPAHPRFDARQPCGRAVEVGSWLTAGYDYGGAGVVRRMTQETSLTDAGALAFEGYSPRVWTLPYVTEPGASVLLSDARSELDKLIERDPLVLDVVAQNSSWMVRFDVHTVTDEHDSTLPYRRQNLMTGKLVAQTAPIGYSPRPITATGFGEPFSVALASNNLVIPSNGVALSVNILGDRSAYLQWQTGYGFQSVLQSGWFLGYQPGATWAGPMWAASYCPNTSSVASVKGGFNLAAGSSQVFGIAGDHAATGPIFLLPPNVVSALPDVVRMFAVVANATTATAGVFAVYGGRHVASNLAAMQNIATTPVAWMWPLAASGASELPMMQMLDLGEVRVPKTRRGMTFGDMGGVGGGAQYMAIQLRGATSPAAASNFRAMSVDSLLMLPAGPSCFIFSVPSVLGINNGQAGEVKGFSMWPSVGVYADMTNGLSTGTDMGGYAGNYDYGQPFPMTHDVSGLAVGPYPLLPPGRGMVSFVVTSYTLSGGIPPATTNRYAIGSGVVGLNYGSNDPIGWHYFPRWAFIK